MKRLRRKTAILTALLMFCSSFIYAGTAAIVSPATYTIVYSDSLLVSVKVTEPKTVRVTIYEEKEFINEQLVSVNVSSITESDLVIIANGPAPVFTTDTAITASGVSATTSPVTASLAAPELAPQPTLSNGSNVIAYTSVALGEAANYTCSTQLGFYTKQISNINPGLYRVQVETLDEAQAVAETVNSLVAVKPKPIVVKSNIFATPQTGALQFLQNLLKSIFR